MKKINVVQPTDQDEIPTNIIATEICKISDGVAALRKGRLKDNALFVLLKAACPSVSMTDIKTVIEGLEDLKRKFVK